MTLADEYFQSTGEKNVVDHVQGVHSPKSESGRDNWDGKQFLGAKNRRRSAAENGE